MNKNFVRVPRPSNEKGKGAYWTLATHTNEKKVPYKSNKPKVSQNLKSNKKQEPFLIPKETSDVYEFAYDQNMYNQVFDCTQPPFNFLHSQQTSTASLDFSMSNNYLYDNVWMPEYGYNYPHEDYKANDASFRELDWINPDVCDDEQDGKTILLKNDSDVSLV